MLDRYDYELEDVIIDEKNELLELKKQKQEALDFIEKKCVYDEHLQGYCMGLTPGEVRTLVLKLGGKKEV